MLAHPVPEHDVAVAPTVHVVQRHVPQLVYGRCRERGRRDHRLIWVRQDAACETDVTDSTDAIIDMGNHRIHAAQLVSSSS